MLTRFYGKTATILIFAILFYCTFAFSADSISKDLGNKGISFGSSEQAAALSSLIKENPGANRYQISYTTDLDVVIFGCDLSSDVIIRLHNKPDGHGSSETWSGDIMHRLFSAAGGGSLNDTPDGKKPGSFQSF